MDGKATFDLDASIRQLEEERQKKIWMAEKWKEYSLKNVQHIYESQLKEAQEEYEYQKQAVIKRWKAVEQDRLQLTANGTGRSKKGKRGASLAVPGSELHRMTTRNASRRRGRYEIGREGNGHSAVVGGGGAVYSYGSSGSGDGSDPYGLGRVRKLNPPQINYTLTEEEIVSDLSLLCNKGVLTPEEKKKLFQEAMDDSITSNMILTPTNDQPTSPFSVSNTKTNVNDPAFPSATQDLSA
jgi:hypothetical protein